MADSFLPVYTPSPSLALDKGLDAESVDFGGGTIRYRERVQVGGVATGEIARVLATTPDGTEMGLAVRVSGPLPAGSAAIGGVTVSSIVPGGGGTNLGKVVAATGGATDTGVASLALRVDTLATITPTVGQYARLQVDSLGALHVKESEINQVMGTVAHDSPDTQAPVKIGGRATAALFTVVTEGDRTDASFDLQGRLRVLPPLIDTDDESIARNQSMPVGASLLYAGDGLGLAANARKLVQSIGNNLLVHEAAAKGTTTVTQVTVNNSTANGVSLIAANSAGTRRCVVVTNHSTEPVYVNTGNLTAGGTSVGEIIAGVVGAWKPFNTVNALRATVVTGPVTVSVREEVLA